MQQGFISDGLINTKNKDKFFEMSLYKQIGG